MEQMQGLYRGKLQANVSLDNFTTWKVGGPAEYFFQPADLDDLATFLQHLPAEYPVVWLGLGSNTLIRDQGLPGVVIAPLGKLKQLSVLEDGLVRAEAGVSCAQVARFCARQGLEGAEFLAGVPGTMGGALAMNAGCHGSETWEHAAKVETINRQGHIQCRPADDFHVEYRYVESPANEWFVAGYLQLQQGEREASLQKIRELLDRRARTQPTSEPTGGSVFRNPPGDYSARLIEHCGLKGFSIGGARVSEKHANFIVNEGTATAADIESLISHVADVVEQKSGIRLITEVHILGK